MCSLSVKSFYTFLCVEFSFVSWLGSYSKCSVVSCSVGKMSQVQRQRIQGFFAEPTVSQVSWQPRSWGASKTCCVLHAAECWAAERTCLPRSQNRWRRQADVFMATSVFLEWKISDIYRNRTLQWTLCAFLPASTIVNL